MKWSWHLWRQAVLRCRLAPLLLGAIVVGLVTSPLGAERPETGQSNKPVLVPLPPTMPAPPDNPTTPAKVALGKQLFFDNRLSGDGTMSCATCHVPERAFGDALAVARGAAGRPLARNTPTLLNAGFHSSYFWDGRATSLEEQALKPIESPEEMDLGLEELEKRLNAVPGYVEQFQQVFGTPVTRQAVGQALAAFQRTLVTGPSALDRYLAGEKQALSPDAKRGLELFLGDAGCVQCHHGPLLSDGQFHRLGVAFGDQGRAAVTGDEEDRYKFRTPSLRNVAETGPYMHNGSIKTLHGVVEFYYRRAPLRGPDGLPLDIEPLLGQSYTEIDLLVAFLRSLSGEAPPIVPPELPGSGEVGKIHRGAGSSNPPQHGAEPE